MFKEVLNSRNTPNQRILSECRDEKFTFKIYLEASDHVISYAEIEGIDVDKVIYKYENQNYSFKTNEITEIQTLPKSKVVNVFIKEKNQKQLAYLMVPLIIGIAAAVYGEIIEEDWLIGAGVTFAATSYFTTFIIIWSQAKRYRQKINRAIESSRINTLIHNLDESTTEEDYFNKLIAVNLKYMDDYYYLVQIQTSKSYGLTRFGALVGFLVLIVGVGLSYVDSSNITGKLTIVSGVIIEFISAIFFYLYNRTIQQLNIYHDKLIAVQDTTLALKVAQSINDENLKNQTMRYLTEILTNKLIKTPETISGDSGKE